MVIVDSDNGSNQMVLITVILMIGMTVKKKKNLKDKFSPASNYVPTPTRNLSPSFVTKSFKQKAVNI